MDVIKRVEANELLYRSSLQLVFIINISRERDEEREKHRETEIITRKAETYRPGAFYLSRVFVSYFGLSGSKIRKLLVKIPSRFTQLSV